MRIIILVDDEDLRRPVISKVVESRNVVYGKAALEVIHDDAWRASWEHSSCITVNVNVDYNNDRLEIGAGGSVKAYHPIGQDDLVGIVISHLGVQHGGRGQYGAFRNVCFGQKLITNPSYLTNMYYQGGWMSLSKRPCICIAGTTSGLPIQKIIQDFQQGVQGNLDALQKYLQDLCR